VKIRRAATIALMIVAAAPFAASFAGAAQEPALSLRGQLSGWLGYHDAPSAESALGLRYIPDFSLKLVLGRAGPWTPRSPSTLMNPSAAGRFQPDASGEVKPYRMWVRLASDRFEARLGLQKINFGSAMLLRPLMWFDRIDPNDPLQLTDGVYGSCSSTPFPATPTSGCGPRRQRRPQGLGDRGHEKKRARIRRPRPGPVPAGEAALSYHHRTIDMTAADRPPAGRTDESARGPLRLRRQMGSWRRPVDRSRPDPPRLCHDSLRFQRSWTVGLDYTFDWGNGLHVLAEHLNAAVAAGAWDSGVSRDFTGLTADYPLGLLDRMSAMIFYSGSTGDWYRLLTWRRTYDR